MRIRRYCGVTLQNVGLSWYMLLPCTGLNPDRWVGMSWAEARRYIDGLFDGRKRA